MRLRILRWRTYQCGGGRELTAGRGDGVLGEGDQESVGNQSVANGYYGLMSRYVGRGGTVSGRMGRLRDEG